MIAFDRAPIHNLSIEQPHALLPENAGIRHAVVGFCGEAMGVGYFGNSDSHK